MAEKTKLVCLRTNGRWNKGDEASFTPETAKKYVDAKNAAWALADADGGGGSDDPVKAAADKAAAAKNAGK